MKKFLKITAITGGCLALVGGFTFTIAFGATGWDVQELSNVKAEQKRYEESVDAPVERITLDLQNTDIQVVFDENAEKVSVDYSQRFKKNGDPIGKIRVNEENGELRIVEKSSWKDGFLVWDFTSYKTTVVLPCDKPYTLAVDTDNGDITVRGNGTLDSLTLSTDNGDVSTKEASLVCAEKMSMDSDNGDCTLGEISAKTVKVETDNGSVNVAGKLTASEITLETDNGNVVATKAPIQADKISIETNNGDIRAHVFGESSDYTKIIETDNGDSNIHSAQGGAKTLVVETDNGDITVHFKKE
ncbi:MAG: DUF4097 family beta strand repeat protein [Clostridia bacterium]|nr:DUF4097 family beta strand repeat protein [Clostridia bacterium]